MDFFKLFRVWCLDLSDGCLELSDGCLDLSFGCLDLSFGCLDLSFGCLDLSFGCLTRGETETVDHSNVSGPFMHHATKEKPMLLQHVNHKSTV